MELYLIRHGRTKGNISGVYQGAIDMSLSEEGIQDANEVKEKLKEYGFDKVYSSPLKRCIETSNVIFKDTQIEILNELREIDFGIWEGKSYKEIGNDYKEEFQSFINDYKNFKFPEGEGFKDFYKRVGNALDKIKELNEEKVAIVAHEGTLRAIITKLINIGEEGFYKFKFEHNGFSKIQVYDSDCQIINLNN